MRLVSFGGETLPGQAARDDLSVAARSALVNLPGGAFDMDGTPGVLQSSTLSLAFTVVPDADDTIDEILEMLGRGRRILKGVLRDNSTYRQCWAKLVSVRRAGTVRDVDVEDLGIDWERDYPYWLATADEPVYLDNGEELDDGWSLDAGNKTAISVTTLSTAQTINNTGGAKIPRARIVITPAAGASITDPRIYNRTTEQWILFAGTIAAGSELEIDCLSKTITLNHADAYSDFAIGDQVDWMDLAIGNNSVVVTANAVTGTVAVNIYWSKHYL